ncbi:DUF3368 domain-containing protein [Romeria aff. gracilis LEGE 07310]|uniref:DUF3368 domain-containing protein n=1 Tax=Vasconcelosia minhoensis LEGE 07310 TaxID=915328 RepID=A0A8J7AIE3_9CYAN|nr:DUF3368 domain-containing protein [Romeria gracilis]MBE9075975.1 DUF3368 domain-containing protein [Romeria aff. gracilis LEGE 07310]
MQTKDLVVNASPLIALFKSQLADLLPQMFDQIRVPPAVFREVTAYKNDIAAQALPHTSWISQTEAVNISSLVLAWDLGAGESEVLSYAIEHPTFTAMIDDAAARRCPVSCNIPTLGTAGLTVLAKRRGLISSVMEPVQALRNAGLWLSDDLIRLLKQKAGE